MKPWHQRTMFRAALAAILAVLAALKASIGDGLTSEELVDLVYAGLGAFAIWLGVGAIPGSPTEPFLNARGDVDVPAPPADPEPPDA